MDGSNHSFDRIESLLVKDTCSDVNSSDPALMPLQNI